MTVKYEQVRDWVLALPGGEEVMVEQWDHPTLRVHNKMFASGMSGSKTMTVKASKQEQEALIAESPEVFSIPAYVGRYGWVQVDLSKVDRQELHELVIEAWRRTAPKKLVKQYETQATK